MDIDKIVSNFLSSNEGFPTQLEEFFEMRGDFLANLFNLPPGFTKKDIYQSIESFIKSLKIVENRGKVEKWLKDSSICLTKKQRKSLDEYLLIAALVQPLLGIPIEIGEPLYSYLLLIAIADGCLDDPDSETDIGDFAQLIFARFKNKAIDSENKTINMLLHLFGNIENYYDPGEHQLLYKYIKEQFILELGYKKDKIDPLTYMAKKGVLYTRIIFYLLAIEDPPNCIDEMGFIAQALDDLADVEEDFVQKNKSYVIHMIIKNGLLRFMNRLATYSATVFEDNKILILIVCQFIIYFSKKYSYFMGDNPYNRFRAFNIYSKLNLTSFEDFKTEKEFIIYIYENIDIERLCGSGM